MNPSRPFRWILSGLACALAGLAPLSALAQHRFAIQETALLPAYCRTHPHTMLGEGSENWRPNPAESERWKAVIGAHAYEALHHYCWAQMLTNRARMTAKSKQERSHLLGEAINDMEYVLRHTNGRPFVLTPEIHMKKGENLLELGQTVQGLNELQRAIEFKPDYWPPYAIISDYNKKIGDLPKAREWLQKALAIEPDAKALLSRQAALGGVTTPPRKPSAAPATPPPATPETTQPPSAK